MFANTRCAWALVLLATSPWASLASQQTRKHPTEAALGIAVDRVVSRSTRVEESTQHLAKSGEALRRARTIRTVGSEDGDENEVFGAISGAVIDERGRLLILDRSFNAVRILPANGAPVTVGRRGSGPLDLRFGVAIWPHREGGFVVADGVLGVKQIDARTTVAKLQRVVDPGTDITGACPTRGGFAVYRTPGKGHQLVQVYDTLGKAGAAFGEPYQAESPLVVAILSEGVVGCLENGNFIYAISGQPFLRGHDAAGKRLWTLRLQDFVVGIQDESIDAQGRRSIGLSGDSQNFSLITNIVGYGLHEAIVQVIHHNQRSLRSRKDFDRMDTYVVDGRTGRAIFVGSDLPRISQVTNKNVVFFTNDPYPQVIIRELAR